MMKTKRNVWSFSLSVLILICLFPLYPIIGNAADYHTGDVIDFGSYPQTLISEETLVAQLEAASAEIEWQPMWYTSDTANEAYFYKDVLLGENEYRAVRFTKWNSNAQSRYGYEKDTVYWFRFDPISWTVLDPETGLLIANAVLDTQPYNHTVFNGNYADADHLYYLNNYAHSTIRTWLNGAFYDAAFSEEEAEVLVLREQDNSMPGMDATYTQYACENTGDLVFLPSYEEVSNEEWFAGNHDRVRCGTAYARALGVENYYDQTHEAAPENDFWFLRSPDHIPNKQGYIGLAGQVFSGIDCCSFDVGVCPAVYADLSAYDRLGETDDPVPSAYDSLTFSYADGILFVSGTGEIPTADEADPAPFAPYAEECRVIIIGEGIGAVAADAFAGLDGVKKLILNGPIALEANAFAANGSLDTVICASSAELDADAFAADAAISFFEPKAAPHTGTAAKNVNVIPYSFADGTLTFEGGAAMDTYGLLDLMAVMCGYYEPVRFVCFSSYTSLDAPFYVYNKTAGDYVPAENNTLSGVRFSVKVPGEKDWETVTFNDFCILAQEDALGTFRLVADIETGEDVQDNDYEITEEQPPESVFKRVLKWLVGLLNKLFSIFSKL